MKRLTLLAVCTLALAACSDPEAERQAQAAAVAAAKAEQEAKADKVVAEYEREVAAENWERARIHGGALMDVYKETDAAARIAPGFAEVKQKAEAARELRRMQALWNYNQQTVGTQGVQRSADIHGKDRVDVDGSGPKPVQLVFRDHPQWKQHAYLVLQAGDFRCPGGCRVQVSVDGGTPRAMAAWRPDTDEAIAMFITDHRALWAQAKKAKTLSIEFPVKAGGTRTVLFETAGLDPRQMPWK